MFYTAINFAHGDILDFHLGKDVSSTVIPVNCRGVMGAGLGLQFKERHPDLFEEYKAYCDNGELKVGTVKTSVQDGAWYYYFPTKDDWRDKSSMDYIVQGLSYMALRTCVLGPIAFPKLGCGCGGLDWDRVLPIMLFYLDKLHATTHIYLGE
jgi:O-acetyl-ADP-ribose deacetylase (regulator of RNase III)